MDVNLALAAKLYVVAALVFVVVDLVWLGIVAAKVYRRILGDLLADSTNIPAAIAFYALFVAGLVFFVIGPAVESGSLGEALVRGALFGLVTYASWDLTNLAVLRDFPIAIVPIDMAWGTALGTLVSGITWKVADLFFV